MTSSTSDKKVKLSPRQKEIVGRLQNGGNLITDQRSAWISNPAIQKEYKDEKMNLKTFFNLKEKGIIWQNFRNHSYELTQLGRTIKL